MAVLAKSVRSRHEESSAQDIERSLETFLAAFEPVIVDGPEIVVFNGSLPRGVAKAIWTWICRDLDPSIAPWIDDLRSSGETAAAAMDAAMPAMLEKVIAAVKKASVDADANRRLTVSLESVRARNGIDAAVTIMKSRVLIEKAQSFGRAANGLTDEVALGQSLASMPLTDAALAAPLMHAMVDQCAYPARLTVAAIMYTGRASEQALRAAGFGSLIEAVLAHAQNQLAVFETARGPFVDMDLVCRAIDRFHRLMRSVSLHVDLERNSRWSEAIAGFVRAASERLEPRLRDLPTDVAQSLRRARTSVDRVDEDRLLAALNGMYLAAAVRAARDSLALNVVLEQVWQETGRSLEILLERNLDDMRANPKNFHALKRLETGIAMSRLRFGADYADTMADALDKIVRRPAALA